MSEHIPEEGEMCDCDFDEYEEGDADYGEESWHYRRTCLHCGHTWYGLHCPHDGRQNPCPSCGIIPAVVHEEDDG